jgi:hypothetical protein
LREASNVSIKNEHIVWAYAEKDDGRGQVLILGLTDTGLEFLKKGDGREKKTLVVNPPGNGFTNVVQVVVFHEKDKATLKLRLAESGTLVSEVN